MKNQDQTASTHKTKINIAIVSNFLERRFTNTVSNIKYISGGESSQAFSFKVDNEEYVIRVNDRNPDGFR
jgi:aminoglycoside phosphotransferase (APT) family kinase protein